MIRPIPYRVLAVIALVMATLCVLLGVRALVMPPWPRAVDGPSYGSGWAYVVNRQPGGHGAASPEARTDTGVRWACRVYVNGPAQLDGVRDVNDFLAGCDDAATLTRLEPGAGR